MDHEYMYEYVSVSIHIRNQIVSTNEKCNS